MTSYGQLRHGGSAPAIKGIREITGGKNCRKQIDLARGCRNVSQETKVVNQTQLCASLQIRSWHIEIKRRLQKIHKVNKQKKETTAKMYSQQWSTVGDGEPKHCLQPQLKGFSLPHASKHRARMQWKLDSLFIYRPASARDQANSCRTTWLSYQNIIEMRRERTRGNRARFGPPKGEWRPVSRDLSHWPYLIGFAV